MIAMHPSGSQRGFTFVLSAVFQPFSFLFSSLPSSSLPQYSNPNSLIHSHCPRMDDLLIYQPKRLLLRMSINPSHPETVLQVNLLSPLNWKKKVSSTFLLLPYPCSLKQWAKLHQSTTNQTLTLAFPQFTDLNTINKIKNKSIIFIEKLHIYQNLKLHQTHSMTLP